MPCSYVIYEAVDYGQREGDFPTLGEAVAHAESLATQNNMGYHICKEWMSGGTEYSEILGYIWPKSTL